MLTKTYIAATLLLAKPIQIDSEVLEYGFVALLIFGFFKLLLKEPSKGKAQNNVLYVGAVVVGIVLLYHMTN